MRSSNYEPVVWSLFRHAVQLACPVPNNPEHCSGIVVQQQMLITNSTSLSPAKHVLLVVPTYSWQQLVRRYRRHGSTFFSSSVNKNGACHMSPDVLPWTPAVSPLASRSSYPRTAYALTRRRRAFTVRAHGACSVLCCRNHACMCPSKN